MSVNEDTPSPAKTFLAVMIEDVEKTDETTGIGVIEVVPLFFTGHRALYMYGVEVCLWWSYFYCSNKNPAIPIHHHQPRGFL